MTADLAEWLSAQLDADEAVARTATRGPWSFRGEGGRQPDGESWSEWVVDFDGGGEYLGGHPAGLMLGDHENAGADAAHIALHDPAFELDRIAALRAVVDEHYLASPRGLGGPNTCPTCQVVAPCPTLLALAQPYRDRPGWRDEWGTG